MKPKILISAFLVAVMALFLVSCSSTRTASSGKNYPVVKKIKTSKSLHADFRSGGQLQRSSSEVDGSRENEELTTRIQENGRKTKLLTKKEVRALEKTSEKIRMPIHTVNSLKEDDSPTDEEVLATLETKSLEYVILKKSLEYTAKKAEKQDDPRFVKKKNPLGFAVASFVISLVGLIIAGIPLGIVAIILAMIALNRYKKYGGTMKGFAIAGLIIGVIDIIGALIVLAMI